MDGEQRPTVATSSAATASCSTKASSGSSRGISSRTATSALRRAVMSLQCLRDGVEVTSGRPGRCFPARRWRSRSGGHPRARSGRGRPSDPAARGRPSDPAARAPAGSRRPSGWGGRRRARPDRRGCRCRCAPRPWPRARRSPGPSGSSVSGTSVSVSSASRSAAFSSRWARASAARACPCAACSLTSWPFLLTTAVGSGSSVSANAVAPPMDSAASAVPAAASFRVVVRRMDRCSSVRGRCHPLPVATGARRYIPTSKELTMNCAACVT